MFKNYLLIAYRNLLKNKLFVSINILGLSIAIASCIVAYLNYNFNANFDIEQENANEIYRINSDREFQERTITYGMVPKAAGEIIRQNVPELKSLVRIVPGFGGIRIEDDLFVSNITYADEQFFEMFTFEVEGNIDLKNKSNIYISNEIAQKYFGDEDPIGKPITHVMSDKVKDYTVAGIFKKKPGNSSFAEVSAITNYENFFDANSDSEITEWNSWNLTFIQTDNPNLMQVVEGELKKMIEPQNLAREDFKVTRYYLDPLPGMAQRSEDQKIGSFLLRQGIPGPAVTVPLFMAGLLLLLACFNFTNTSIAVSGRRLKEIGLRKVMGGVKKQLVMQFLTENIMLCFVALVLGLVFAELLVPVYSEMWPFLDLSLSYSENTGLILFLVFILFFTGILAGSYPAFYVSKFSPTQILKRTEKYGGAGVLSKVLLVFQFTISLIGIIFAISFIENARYQKNFDLGYISDGVLHVQFDNQNDYDVYKNQVEASPMFNLYTGTEHQLNESYYNDPVRYETTEIETDLLMVDENYFETMDVKLIEGRNFKKDSETDRAESVIVSKKFVKDMEWEEALGKRIVWRDSVQLFVVGVVEDLYTRSLWDELQPVIFRMVEQEEYRYLTVKVEPENTQKAFSELEEIWKDLFPNRFFTGEYFDVGVEDMNMINGNIVKMFGFLGAVAVILALAGLYSLVSLNIIKRMKEIAVRKVLGATVSSVAIKLNIPFIIILVISAIIGSSLSYFAVDGLFNSIWAYHVDLGVLVFIGCSVMFAAIAIATVGWKVINAASANPASTLRSD